MVGSPISPMPKEICCTNNLLAVTYLNKYYPELSIDDFINDVLNSGTFLVTDINTGKTIPVDKEYILNSNNWISSELFNLLMKKGKELTNDPLFSYKVGRESFALRNLGVKKTILKLMHPQEIVKRIPIENDKLNRTKRIEIVKNKKKQGIVRLYFKKHLVENKFTSKEACAQNRGVYEGLGLLTGHLTSVEERYCTFEGHDYCEFVINWKYKSFFSRLLDLFRRWVAKDLINDLEDKEKQNLDLIHEQELVIESRTNELKETQAEVV